MARKILLADDSVTAQNMGRKILADAGYDVVTVNNGSAALKRIAEIKPDLIVLDVYMPGYSGLEVCQRLKDGEETSHIPVLLTVGKLEPFKPEEARRVRADAHIVKPFEASELLTAITKLEDRMVPQSDTRFSASVAGVERFGGEGGGRKTEGSGDADTGWKSRLRFPSKKKKEPEPEPEPEEVAGDATFRNYRKGKGKNGGNVAFTVKAPAPAGQEPGLVPDIPRDITPDELDALSALAAKLDGPIPEAEDIAPLAEKMGPIGTSLVEAAAAKAETGTTEAVRAEVEELAVVAPAVEPAEIVTGAIPVVEAIVEKSDIAIPVEQTESRAEAGGDNAKPEESAVQASGVASTEPQRFETPGAVVAVHVETLAEAAAPIDRADEPAFATGAASAPTKAETIAEAVVTEEKIKEKPVAAVDSVQAEIAETKAAAEAGASEVKSKPAEPDAKPQSAEVVGVVEAVPVQEQPEEPAPTDEELAEALRLLTPATGHSENATIPSHGTLVAAGQLLAAEAARNAADDSRRWVAEPVSLSAEEAAMSLEAEMFRTFAATATASTGEIGVARITGVAGITAAVETRLAALDWAQNKEAKGQPEIEKSSDTVVKETVAVEVQGGGDTAAVALVENEAAKSKVEEKKISEVKLEESATEEDEPATFADAMQKDTDERGEAEAPVANSAAAVLAVAEADKVEDSSPEVGEQESMGKDGKGKSNWHQIRTAPTTAAGGDAVEAAKQGQSVAEAAPKAMAAAASAEGSGSSSTPDASTIASIVDSVMADLRPKIVEEIAKKLAGK